MIYSGLTPFAALEFYGVGGADRLCKTAFTFYTFPVQHEEKLDITQRHCRKKMRHEKILSSIVNNNALCYSGTSGMGKQYGVRVLGHAAASFSDYGKNIKHGS